MRSPGQSLSAMAVLTLGSHHSLLGALLCIIGHCQVAEGGGKIGLPCPITSTPARWRGTALDQGFADFLCEEPDSKHWRLSWDTYQLLHILLLPL